MKKCYHAQVTFVAFFMLLATICVGNRTESQNVSHLSYKDQSSESHCSGDCSAESSTSSSSSGSGSLGIGPRGFCFPADALVFSKSRGTISISNLNVGENIQVRNESYSNVFGFTHDDPDAISDFIRLSTKDGNTIELSDGHFIYVNEFDNIKAARFVSIGDYLLTASGIRSQVTSKMYVKKKGLFNPQTMHGNIVVNNISVTTFTETVETFVGHSLLSPFRAVFKGTGIAVMS